MEEDKRLSSNKIFLKSKIEVAKFVKYIITDLIDGVSQSNMFVYDNIVYLVNIKEHKCKK